MLKTFSVFLVIKSVRKFLTAISRRNRNFSRIDYARICHFFVTIIYFIIQFLSRFCYIFFSFLDCREICWLTSSRYSIIPWRSNVKYLRTIFWTRSWYFNHFFLGTASTHSQLKDCDLRIALFSFDVVQSAYRSEWLQFTRRAKRLRQPLPMLFVTARSSRVIS